MNDIFVVRKQTVESLWICHLHICGSFVTCCLLFYFIRWFFSLFCCDITALIFRKWRDAFEEHEKLFSCLTSRSNLCEKIMAIRLKVVRANWIYLFVGFLFLIFNNILLWCFGRKSILSEMKNTTICLYFRLLKKKTNFSVS